MFDPKVLSPLKDPSFYAALGAVAAGESAAFTQASGSSLFVGIIASVLPLLVWLQSHSKHRLAALDAAVTVASLASSEADQGSANGSA